MPDQTIPLESLDYQSKAVSAVVDALYGQLPYRFSDSNFGIFDVYPNVLDVSSDQILKNKQRIISSSGITPEKANLTDDLDFCIEMETGTGKTIVYLRTIYELHRAYGLTKFIILVPSVPIREGVLASMRDFAAPLEELYGFPLQYFEYDSKKLPRLREFIEDSRPQLMVTTLQAFNADDRVLNRRDIDRAAEYSGTLLETIGRCRPVIIMDEPQEGMDTDNAKERLANLTPALKLRYSATHKTLRNLLYRLTPGDAYREGLVKKIEVLSVLERNDEATLKLEFAEVQLAKDKRPQAKLKAFHSLASGFKWKATRWLKEGSDLAAITNNESLSGYIVDRIWKSMDGVFRVKFKNGVEIDQNSKAGDVEGVFRLQLRYLIQRHYEKKARLLPLRIKPLSLIFIDRVANYRAPFGEDAMIKRLFEEEYAAYRLSSDQHNVTDEELENIQGSYFATTNAGIYTDSQISMAKNKAMYDEILRDKSALLALDNPREFIFTHSALGVGWDNPNVFNIATLNVAHDDARKRQEIGRGLRICRDVTGRRVYDEVDTPEDKEINLLSIVPSESYESFVEQYQNQNLEDTDEPGPKPRKRHKNKPSKTVINRTSRFESEEFREFWERLARKTSYTVQFDEMSLIADAATKIASIDIGSYEAEITRTRLTIDEEDKAGGQYIGQDFQRLRPEFTPFDIVETISEQTGLAYRTVFAIIDGLKDYSNITRNPARWVAEAVAIIQRCETEAMMRGLTYRPIADTIPLTELKSTIETFLPIEPTPNRGVYDAVPLDSDSTPERHFARDADRDGDVVCFLKLPDSYRIAMPIGGTNKTYNPDFGLVVRRRSTSGDAGQSLYMVVETKGTSDIDDTRSLTEEERLKIRCAIKHFEALQIEAKFEYSPYVAPVKDYRRDFKDKLP